MAVDYFLKISDIPGESLDDKHKGEIQCFAFKYSEEQDGSFSSGSGGGTGKVKMDPFEFLAPIGKQSAKLQNACDTGKHIPEAVFAIRKAGGTQEDYYTVTLKEVLVSKYKIGARPDLSWAVNDELRGDGEPLEMVSLSFAEIQREYKPQGSDGAMGSPVKTGYNLKQNKPV